MKIEYKSGNQETGNMKTGRKETSKFESFTSLLNFVCCFLNSEFKSSILTPDS